MLDFFPIIKFSKTCLGAVLLHMHLGRERELILPRKTDPGRNLMGYMIMMLHPKTSA